jgi:SOS response regulatory protein OraA/RecX
MKIKTLKINEKSKYVLIGIENDEGYKSYKVSESFYLDIGAPEIGASLLSDTVSLIEEENEYYEALKKALSLLEYSDNSKSMLFKKLLMRKVNKDAARYAVKRCVDLGYLDEERQLKRLVLDLANSSLLGKNKIVAKLVAKGYLTTDIYKTIAILLDEGEIDFEHNKQKLIKKHSAVCGDEEALAKLLYKHGFKDD